MLGDTVHPPPASVSIELYEIWMAKDSAYWLLEERNLLVNLVAKHLSAAGTKSRLELQEHFGGSDKTSYSWPSWGHGTQAGTVALKGPGQVDGLH